jgi:outer membrane protein OmpA-like peptidoglycan-associated protein
MRRTAMFIGWLGLVCTSPAQAGNVIDVHLTDKVVPGQKPSLTISVHADLKSLELDLKRDDGKRVQISKDNVPRDSERTFELPQTHGRHRYRGKLNIHFHSGEGGSMNLDFTALIMPSMGLTVRHDELDLHEHALTLRAKRPLTRVDYSLTADTGQALGEGSFEAPRAATKQRLGWEQKPGKVLKIHLVAHDAEGFSEELDLFPWSWSVPHEELEFETGHADILPAEAPKLDKSYSLLQQGLEKYGKLLPIKLYIAGHTDTVAAADYNQRLSEKRALSIARYFRHKGFKYPIFYKGFGERKQKVKTPDNTDEARNRRAEYMLAAQSPRLGEGAGSGGWKRL